MASAAPPMKWEPDIAPESNRSLNQQPVGRSSPVRQNSLHAGNVLAPAGTSQASDTSVSIGTSLGRPEEVSNEYGDSQTPTPPHFQSPPPATPLQQGTSGSSGTSAGDWSPHPKLSQQNSVEKVQAVASNPPVDPTSCNGPHSIAALQEKLYQLTSQTTEALAAQQSKSEEVKAAAAAVNEIPVSEGGTGADGKSYTMGVSSHEVMGEGTQLGGIEGSTRGDDERLRAMGDVRRTDECEVNLNCGIMTQSVPMPVPLQASQVPLQSNQMPVHTSTAIPASCLTYHPLAVGSISLPTSGFTGALPYWTASPSPSTSSVASPQSSSVSEQHGVPQSHHPLSHILSSAQVPLLCSSSSASSSHSATPHAPVSYDVNMQTLQQKLASISMTGAQPLGPLSPQSTLHSSVVAGTIPHHQTIEGVAVVQHQVSTPPVLTPSPVRDLTPMGVPAATLPPEMTGPERPHHLEVVDEAHMIPQAQVPTSFPPSMSSADREGSAFSAVIVDGVHLAEGYVETEAGGQIDSAPSAMPPQVLEVGGTGKEEAGRMRTRPAAIDLHDLEQELAKIHTSYRRGETPAVAAANQVMQQPPILPIPPISGQHTPLPAPTMGYQHPEFPAPQLSSQLPANDYLFISMSQPLATSTQQSAYIPSVVQYQEYQEFKPIARDTKVVEGTTGEQIAPSREFHSIASQIGDYAAVGISSLAACQVLGSQETVREFVGDQRPDMGMLPHPTPVITPLMECSANNTPESLKEDFETGKDKEYEREGSSGAVNNSEATKLPPVRKISRFQVSIVPEQPSGPEVSETGQAESSTAKTVTQSNVSENQTHKPSVMEVRRGRFSVVTHPDLSLLKDGEPSKPKAKAATDPEDEEDEGVADWKESDEELVGRVKGDDRIGWREPSSPKRTKAQPHPSPSHPLSQNMRANTSTLLAPPTWHPYQQTHQDGGQMSPQFTFPQPVIRSQHHRQRMVSCVMDYGSGEANQEYWQYPQKSWSHWNPGDDTHTEEFAPEVKEDSHHLRRQFAVDNPESYSTVPLSPHSPTVPPFHSKHSHFIPHVSQASGLPRTNSLGDFNKEPSLVGNIPKQRPQLTIPTVIQPCPSRTTDSGNPPLQRWVSFNDLEFAGRGPPQSPGGHRRRMLPELPKTFNSHPSSTPLSRSSSMHHLPERSSGYQRSCSVGPMSIELDHISPAKVPTPIRTSPHAHPRNMGGDEPRHLLVARLKQAKSMVDLAPGQSLPTSFNFREEPKGEWGQEQNPYLQVPTTPTETRGSQPHSHYHTVHAGMRSEKWMHPRWDDSREWKNSLHMREDQRESFASQGEDMECPLQRSTGYRNRPEDVFEEEWDDISNPLPSSVGFTPLSIQRDRLARLAENLSRHPDPEDIRRSCGHRSPTMKSLAASFDLGKSM
ncbi:hypothetical protein J437_LFUL000555, partial [Ladona fulva]